MTGLRSTILSAASALLPCGGAHAGVPATDALAGASASLPVAAVLFLCAIGILAALLLGAVIGVTILQAKHYDRAEQDDRALFDFGEAR